MRWAAALALLTMLGAATPAAAQGPGRRVIDAETLRAAGVRRLSDVLLLIEDWDITTVQGLTWRASPRGLGTFEDQGWIVMIGDQRADLQQFGARSLDRLPITVTQIDSVEVLAAARPVFGELATRGLIRFHLRRPARGLSFTALPETANETGDPGPFRFTELETPNIDRIGSGAFGTVAYAGRDGYLEAAGGWREHFVTDAPISGRTFAITTGHYPIIVQSAASLRAGWDFGRAGRHRLLAGRSWTRDYYFLPPFGREVPAQSPFTHIGFDGDFRLAQRTGLRYRAAHEINELQEHPNGLDLDFDWRIERWSAALEAERTVRAGRLRVGGGWERVSAESGFALEDEDLDLFDIYAAFSQGRGRRWSREVGVSLVASGEDVGFRGVASQGWRLDKGRIGISLSFSERLPQEDERIWLWQRRGYDFLPANGVEVTLEGGPRTARLAAADVSWKIALSPELRLGLEAYLRAHSGVTLEERDPTFQPGDETFTGPVRVITDLDGEVAGGAVELEWRPLPRLSTRLYYRYQDALGGDPRFQDAWRAVPRHRAQARALFEAAPGVDLWSEVRYRGSTRWTDYSGARAQSGGAYDERVEDALTFDVAAQKWFWRRRLRLHLLARNIFDDPVPYHPIGVAYGLTFQVALEVRLGTG